MHKLCDYVYSLTVKVSEGYSKYRILDDKDTNTRLMLCLAVKKVLEKAFFLLGLTPVQKIWYLHIFIINIVIIVVVVIGWNR